MGAFGLSLRVACPRLRAAGAFRSGLPGLRVSPLGLEARLCINLDICIFLCMQREPAKTDRRSGGQNPEKSTIIWSLIRRARISAKRFRRIRTRQTVQVYSGLLQIVDFSGF